MTTILYKLDPASEGVLDQHAGRAARLLGNVQDALKQGVDETAAHLQKNYLVGGSPNAKRGGKAPLAVRSNALVGSIDGQMTGVWQGEVGAIRGATAYAKVLLGSKTWTITPKKSKYLWIPIGDNRSARGGAKIDPREARSRTGPKGGKLLSIFMSKAGNLIAFLRDPGGGSYKRGKNKGRLRGRLLFVLKESVEVEGTDALALAVEDKRARVTLLIQDAANQAMEGD